MRILQAWSLKASTAQSTATFKEKHEEGTDRNLRTDYIFVSPHFAVVGASIDVAATESDHQTVWAILC
jgi:endonuclease/exonuclease/phosphatase family metal-dependent hydrolase